MDHFDPAGWYSPRGESLHEIETCECVGVAVDIRGIGVNYRRPEATFVPGATGGRGPDANSLFDSKGSPLPGMDVLGVVKGSR